MASPDFKRCLGCGYILDHLPKPKCPECGRGFDPRDPTTYEGAGESGDHCRHVAVVGAVMLGAAFVLGFAGAWDLTPWPAEPLLLTALLMLVGGLAIELVVLLASVRNLLRPPTKVPDRKSFRAAAAIACTSILAVVVLVAWLLLGWKRVR